MLIAFICIAVVLSLIAMGLAVWPLLKKNTEDGETQRKEDNLAILRAQFEELEAEHAAGRISEEEYEETRTEIQTRVLEENSAAQSELKQGRHGFYAACALLILIPVTAFLIYLEIGSPIALDPDFTRQQAQMQAMQGGHSDAELVEQIKFLEGRLKEQPDNADGWIMLARTSAAMKNWQKSAQAFEQVDRIVGHDADVLADWADVLAASQNGSLEGKPKELIELALSIDPAHWKALALMGTLCFDKADYEGAVKYWTRMLAGVEQGSEEWRQIMENIEHARRAGGLVPAPDEGSLQPVPAQTAKGAVSGAVITGRVELSDEMSKRVKPEDTVFVFARPVEGSKMPVAFIRLAAKDLPAEFKLDSASQMGMGMKTLADVKEVFVEARVSRSGNFMPSSGDLEGAASGRVAVGTQGVSVTIDKVRP